LRTKKNPYPKCKKFIRKYGRLEKEEDRIHEMKERPMNSEWSTEEGGENGEEPQRLVRQLHWLHR
jgi:hypothetical protein